MYGTVILLRKGGLEHFCFLAKVTQKSGQDSGLDPSSSLPAQPPAQARVFAPPSKEDFVEMHFCVPEMMRVSDTGYPNMTCISYSNGRWRSDRDNDDIWWQIFICQALFLALYVVISPLIPIQSYELWAVAIPTFQAKKNEAHRGHTTCFCPSRGSKGWSQDANLCSPASASPSEFLEFISMIPECVPLMPACFRYFK